MKQDTWREFLASLSADCERERPRGSIRGSNKSIERNQSVITEQMKQRARRNRGGGREISARVKVEQQMELFWEWTLSAAAIQTTRCNYWTNQDLWVNGCDYWKQIVVGEIYELICGKQLGVEEIAQMTTGWLLLGLLLWKIGNMI